MSIENGLLHAYLLDGKGGGQPLDWGVVAAWRPEQGVLWLHLEYADDHVRRWVQQESGLDEVAAETLLAEETRPRSVLHREGLLLTLRGVNLNPGADPEDMVAVRLWSDGRRIITTRKRRLQSTADLSRALQSGAGPRDAGEFLYFLTDYLLDKLAVVVEDLEAAVDDLEEAVITKESYELRPRISELRRSVVSLRRYLAPQREAMARLFSENVKWMSELDRLRLREEADRTTRYIEDLDLIRERAVVVQEELMNRLSEKMNRTMYVLSIVAALFLPLGFLTGLLGINVGGIPGTDYPGAFLIVCLSLLALVVVMLWLFKRMKWM